MTAPRQGSAARIVRNTMTNAAGRVVNSVLAIALTPIFLRDLGPEQYGIWLLAATLTFSAGFLSLAELGLNQASIRFVAEAHSRGDQREVNEVVSTTTVIYAVLGAVLALVLVAMAGVFTELFDVSPALARTARSMFMVVGLQIAVDLPASGVMTALEGAQRYGILRGIDVGLRLAWAAICVVLVNRGAGVMVLAWTALATSVLSAAAGLLAARRMRPPLALSLRFVTRATVRRLLRSGTPTMGLRILGVVYSQMDRIVIGVALAATAVAAYDVAYKIHAAAALTLGLMPSAVLPAAAAMGAAGDQDALRRLYLKGTRYSLAIGLPLVVGGIFYARPLIATWVGSDYTYVTGAARLFLVYPALALALVVGQTMLVGLGRMREMLRYHLVAVLTNLAVSVVLVNRFGIIGVIWGTVAGYALLWLPFTRLLLDQFGVTFAGWARTVAAPVAPAIAVQAAFCLLSLHYVEGLGQLWQVVGAFALSCGLAIVTFFLVSPGDRSALVQALRARRPTTRP